MAEIVSPKESYEVQVACFEVYKDKGCGFLEDVYQECLEIELELRGIPFHVQAQMPLTDKGRKLKSIYKPDFIIDNKIVLKI